MKPIDKKIIESIKQAQLSAEQQQKLGNLRRSDVTLFRKFSLLHKQAKQLQVPMADYVKGGDGRTRTQRAAPKQRVRRRNIRAKQVIAIPDVDEFVAWEALQRYLTMLVFTNALKRVAVDCLVLKPLHEFSGLRFKCAYEPGGLQDALQNERMIKALLSGEELNVQPVAEEPVITVPVNASAVNVPAVNAAVNASAVNASAVNAAVNVPAVNVPADVAGNDARFFTEPVDATEQPGYLQRLKNLWNSYRQSKGLTEYVKGLF